MQERSDFITYHSFWAGLAVNQYTNVKSVPSYAWKYRVAHQFLQAPMGRGHAFLRLSLYKIKLRLLINDHRNFLIVVIFTKVNFLSPFIMNPCNKTTTKSY